MKTILRFFTSLVFVSLVGCSALLMPRAADTEYFATTAGGFEVELQKGAAAQLSYGGMFLVKQELPDDAYMVVSFENPANRQQPFVEAASVQEMRAKYAQRNKNMFVLISPPVTGVRRHTQYEIAINVFEGADMQVLLARHQQKVSSSVWGN